jgi:hypothetical protein
MATVPIYDQPQVSPNVGQMPAFQAPGVEPARDFTAKQIEEAGQVQTNLGANLMRIAEKQREVEEQSTLDQVELDVRKFVSDWQQKNADRVGERASGLTEEFTTQYYKLVEDQIQKFGGDKQSRLVKRFQNKANEIGLSSIAKFSTYEANQKQEVRVNNSKALGKMLSNTASSAPFSIKDGKVSDGLEFEKSKTDLIENLKKRADLMGYSENSDVYKQLVQDELSAVYMDRMTNIINTNPTAAPAYFDQVKDFITNDEFKNKFKGMATKVAQEAEAEGWVESKFTEALASKDKNSIANLRLDIMRQFSGDQQKTALQIYEQLEQSMITQNEQIRKTYSSQAWDNVLQSKTTWGNVSNTTKEWLKENDVDTYRSINIYIDNNIQSEKNAAKAARAEERAEARFEAGERRERDRAARERRQEQRAIAKQKLEEKENIAFGELNSIMGSNPKEFINMDLNNWRTKLSESDWKWFSKQQTEFKLRPETQKQSTTLQNRINNESDILGITKNVGKKARFEKIILNDVDSFIANNNGKQPDAKQLNSIINDAKKEYVTSEFIGIKNKSRRFELQKAKTINDIPKDLLGEIKADLDKRKLPATNEDIINIFNVYVGQND